MSAAVRIGWCAETGVVVVGSGVAGLTAAHRLARAGIPTVVVTKAGDDDANTTWAQGGIAVVRDEADPGDSVAAHIRDTLVAGAGLCDPEAVALILREGPGAVRRLIAGGARFDPGPEGLARTREGGHTARRVIHAGGDATGAEVERALLATALPPVLTDHVLLDVLTDPLGSAVGVSVLGVDGTVGVIGAGAVLLATGGAGHLYRVTTNPDVATGDGLAAALRAGAAAADLEFMQFHPTVLFAGAAAGHRPLVTEAVRGEGAVLVDATGARVMAGVHPMADLAPRDVVSLAISRRMAQAPGGVSDHVFLDATGIGAAVFRSRFPTVAAACHEAGVDPTVQPIPVAPAAHFHCGGVITDAAGRTTVPGLYAAGEVARTGLHGANRLASNSLLEGLVMGERAAAAIGAEWRDRVLRQVSSTEVTLPAAAPAGRVVLQERMSEAAGIGRDAAGLADLRAQLDRLGSTPAIHPPDRFAVETANLALVAAALTESATIREESRGCHVRNDHPDADPAWVRAVVVTLVDGHLRTSVGDRSAAPVGVGA